MQPFKFDPANFKLRPDPSVPVTDQAVGQGFEGQGFEAFLIREGLELLRSFREIPDRDVRDAVNVLVKALSRSDVA